ncbi:MULTISPECIES: hypothetical protein [unclassified Rummeliibacillus]|uniref:hypothetical protein n=1 Tax=unclassified Rummeliibacillus TaxID=2622809 RepID=UPI000E66FCA4|nr:MULTISPECIES: hypothetical protein [unclassified Rummeliibacillus]RIJ65002.1 hypothetical protein D1606_08960 [Rummeliibacillus sp. POC4]RPJ94250.1 hypothetical protein CW357_16385 [Rummeliibacillus sp. TYF005]
MDTLKQIIAIEDTIQRRTLMIQYIVDHPTEKDEIVKVINEKNINFWETNMGEPFEMNPYKWDDIYYQNLQIRLNNNFSKEKFGHMLEVAEYLANHQSTLLSENSNEKIKLYGNTMGFIMIWGVVVFIVLIVLVVFYFKNKYA